MSAALLAGVLVAGGVYLLAQRELVRVVIGFVLLGHAANIVLLAAGGLDRRGVPIVDGGPDPTAADPLPQAFVLTAIVITFAVTVYLLTLALRGTPPQTKRTDEPVPVDGDSNEGQPPAGASGSQDAPAVDRGRSGRGEFLAPKGQRP